MTDAKNECAGGASRSDAGLGADFDDAEERHIHQTLAILRESYEKMVKPYLDRLTAIHARRPLRMVVTAAEAEAMGFKVPNASNEGPALATAPLD